MSDEVQAIEVIPEVKKAPNSPKHSQDTWFKVRIEYESGRWTSLKELGHRFGINDRTLWTRIHREKWDVKREVILSKAQSKIEKKTVDVASEYLSNVFKRAKKYEELIDRSISQNDEIISPEHLDAYSRSEARIHELAKSALRIPSASQVDVTSKGQSIGESIIGAIAKLREQGGAPEISEEQAERIMECEVVDSKRVE